MVITLIESTTTLEENYFRPWRKKLLSISFSIGGMGPGENDNDYSNGEKWTVSTMTTSQKTEENEPMLYKTIRKTLRNDPRTIQKHLSVIQKLCQNRPKMIRTTVKRVVDKLCVTSSSTIHFSGHKRNLK